MRWILLLLLMTQRALAQDLLQTGYRAEAFFAAHDYRTAYQMYDTLLQPPLPPWQKVRIQYNLGTILLAQQQWVKALQQLRILSLEAISTPLLLLNLRTNLAFAMLHQAESLINIPQFQNLDLVLYLLEEGLKETEQANIVACHMQRIEEDKMDCAPLGQLNALKEHLLMQLYQARQKQCHRLLQQASLYTKLALLIEGLNNWSQTITLFTSDKKASSSHLGMSLFPLWELIDSKETVFTEAQTHYQEALQAIQKRQIDQGVNLIHQSLQGLQSLQGAPDVDRQLEILLLRSQLLLTAGTFSVSELRKLIKQYKEIEVPKKAAKMFTASIHALEKSLAYLENGHLTLSRFFLTINSFLLQKMTSPSLKTPLDILKRALQHAWQALQLSHLADLERDRDAQAEITRWIIRLQQQALKTAALFIPSVLKTQQEQFSKPGILRCEQRPWDQVIPLFEQGEQTAKQVTQAIKKQSMPVSMLQQEETIIKWQRAVDLLQNPPSEKVSSQKPFPTTTNMQEMFQNLQEMEVEDRPEKPVSQEVNTW